MGQQYHFCREFICYYFCRLTVHDQKSGCLMFYQRQLGGCLCMWPLVGVAVCAYVPECVCVFPLIGRVLLCSAVRVCMKRRGRRGRAVNVLVED